MSASTSWTDVLAQKPVHDVLALISYG